ncbi:DnaJ-domain-containing protein [Aspergillus steynii IBT 23096]|uniref:DnaJ-domain-containing protein n=1 Tax=Aspergillus steynii IBT 23096 TaxID=1392250 RepID=A0A2I2GSB7_9EURO|nr:DnaJ-domain-containing protein [Aspergillus steynii IBT 23096]PLB55775.1 DnaJ-domain-containing protein [Aspergillus steynii IBT 23096]
MSSDEDFQDFPQPVETDLYGILGVSENATPDQIKSAYRKQALRNHPDKVSADSKDEANEKFQQIAFAYAILSDEKRRKRFDLTGSTSEAVEEDGDFNWMDFYREQFSSAIDENALDQFKKDYQGSEEEERDVLAAFDKYRGDLDKVYESVMLCNVIDDDERFRALIDKAIDEGKAERHKKYTEEPEKKKQQRLKRAQKEAKEAEKLAQELEEKKDSKKKGGQKKKKKDAPANDNDLLSIIKQRQASRADSFFDRLEEKYAGGKKRAGKFEEPPEAAFEATAARQTSKKKKTKA